MAIEFLSHRDLRDELVVSVAEWSCGCADQVLDCVWSFIKVSEVRDDTLQSDVRTGGSIICSHSARYLISNVGVVGLPACVDAVDVGVESPPYGILHTDVNAVHEATNSEVSS